MEDILIKAACYVGIIILGYVLRKTGFFGPEAFGVLSKIVIRITLPTAIIASSAARLVLPITETGFTALSVEMRTNLSTPQRTASDAIERVASVLLRQPSDIPHSRLRCWISHRHTY